MNTYNGYMGNITADIMQYVKVLGSGSHLSILENTPNVKQPVLNLELDPKILAYAMMSTVTSQGQHMCRMSKAARLFSICNFQQALRPRNVQVLPNLGGFHLNGSCQIVVWHSEHTRSCVSRLMSEYLEICLEQVTSSLYLLNLCLKRL